MKLKLQTPAPVRTKDSRPPSAPTAPCVGRGLPRKTAFVRQHSRPRGLFVLGLTGVMGSGKTALARELVRAGAVLWDADAEVAKLRRNREELLRHLRASGLNLDPALLAEVARPEVARRREALRQVALLAGGLEVLEDYFLPRLRRQVKQFLGRLRQNGHKLVVLDIPLLFEKDYLGLMDFTLNTHASSYLLTRRLTKRRNKKTRNKKTKRAKPNPKKPLPPSAALQLRLATAQWDISARRKALCHSAGAVIETGLAQAATRRVAFAKLPKPARRVLRR